MVRRRPLRLRKGDKAGAIAAADRAASSTVPSTMYAVAQAYVDASQPKKALPLTARLEGSLSTDARRFARLLTAEGLRAGGKPREAVDVYEEVLHKTDLWLAHFLLARAYLDLGAFTEASSELKTCLGHRGKDPSSSSTTIQASAFYHSRGTRRPARRRG